jgi:hypothetical protein
MYDLLHVGRSGLRLRQRLRTVELRSELRGPGLRCPGLRGAGLHDAGLLGSGLRSGLRRSSGLRKWLRKLRWRLLPQEVLPSFVLGFEGLLRLPLPLRTRLED